MGDVFKKVRPGDKLIIPARTYNAFIDMALQKAILPSSGKPKTSGSSLTAKRAVTTAAAGAGTTITADLIKSDGTQDTAGPGHNITVYCSIIGGGDLDEAIPRLELNDELYVVELPYSSTEKRYYCVSLFQASQDCVSSDLTVDGGSF